MNKVHEILTELENEPSTNAKIAILEKNRGYKLLTNVIHSTLNPVLNFYIKKIPEYEPAGGQDLAWGLAELGELSSRRVTGHAARDHLQYILNSLDKNDADVICRVVKRDLRCGVQEGIVNKVWEGLIPELPMMLAQPMKDKFIKKIKYPAYAQLKSDGARCICVIVDGVAKFYSRNYSEYVGLDDLGDYIIKEAYGGHDFVLDGELLVIGKDGNPVDRKTGNGIINKSVQGTLSKAEADSIIYTVWDIISYKSYFIDGVDKTPYVHRYEDLLCNIFSSDGRVRPIENHVVRNLDEAKAIFNRYLNEGLEGIILKNMNAPWENKRSNNQVKFKAEIMSDLICTGVYEGEKKYTGMLGGINCETKCGKVKVDVGSGFTDAQREEYWNDKDSIIGKVVEVKHNGVITSKSKDSLSVFLPIFQYIRHDKKLEDADTLESIDG